MCRKIELNSERMNFATICDEKRKMKMTNKNSGKLPIHILLSPSQKKPKPAKRLCIKCVWMCLVGVIAIHLRMCVGMMHTEESVYRIRKIVDWIFFTFCAERNNYKHPFSFDFVTLLQWQNTKYYTQLVCTSFFSLAISFSNHTCVRKPYKQMAVHTKCTPITLTTNDDVADNVILCETKKEIAFLLLFFLSSFFYDRNERKMPSSIQFEYILWSIKLK